MRINILLTIISLCLVGCSSSAPPRPVVNSKQLLTSTQKLYVNLPWENVVDFCGLLDPADVDQKSHQVLYDGSAGAGGVAAQILTHALLANGSKNRKYSKAQIAADEVLLPYQWQLTDFTNSQLWHEAKKIGGSAFTNLEQHTEADFEAGVTIVDFTPAFALTQDKKAVVLVNKINAYSSNSPAVSTYYNEIMVVSDSIAADDPGAYWNNIDTSPLQTMAESLFSDSLDLFLQSVSGELESVSAQETMAYWLGGNKKFERASLIENQCSRLIIKSLRGFIMSVPKAISPSFDSSKNIITDC